LNRHKLEESQERLVKMQAKHTDTVNALQEKMKQNQEKSSKMIAEVRKAAQAIAPPPQVIQQQQAVVIPPTVKPSAPVSGTVKTSTPQIVYISVDQEHVLSDYESRSSSPVRSKSRPASSKKNSIAPENRLPKVIP
jgi:hypothetical protein